MDRARHDNIITLLDVFSDDTYLYIVSFVHALDLVAGETQIYILQVQELFGTLSFVSAAEEDEYWIKKWPNGSRCLESYVQINGPMSLQDSKYVFYQLVDAVAHLHSLGISHCDIKPENILIDSTTLKVSPRCVIIQRPGLMHVVLDPRSSSSILGIPHGYPRNTILARAKPTTRASMRLIFVGRRRIPLQKSTIANCSQQT